MRDTSRVFDEVLREGGNSGSVHKPSKEKEGVNGMEPE